MYLNPEIIQTFFLLLSIVTITLGLAGFLGSLLFYLGRRWGRLPQLLLLAITAGILIWMSVVSPWRSIVLIVNSGLVLLVVLLFSLRPFQDRESLWRRENAFCYLSFSLLIILFWALSNKFTFGSLVLALFAALGAVFAWKRSQDTGAQASTRRISQAETLDKFFS